jgi:hypothetical protein
MKKMSYAAAAMLLFSIVLTFSCSTKQPVVGLRQRVLPGSSVAVIVDHPNNIKNLVISRFMLKSYPVTAFNAADIYEMKDVFDIKDFKKVSYNVGVKDDDKSLLAMERSFDSIYKLHVYNFEISKAETLAQIRQKWNVRYLVLLDLRDWEDVCWGRAINLENFEVVWVENYPTRYGDTPERIVDHFISSMSGGK